MQAITRFQSRTICLDSTDVNVSAWGNLRLEGRLRNMLVSIGDVDIVVSRCGGVIGDVAGSVLVVTAFNLALCRSFDSHAQATWLCHRACIDGKFSWLCRHTTFQAGSIGLDLWSWWALWDSADREWWLWQFLPSILHCNKMWTLLQWSKLALVASRGLL